jgi:hypothetical protein
MMTAFGLMIDITACSKHYRPHFFSGKNGRPGRLFLGTTLSLVSGIKLLFHCLYNARVFGHTASQADILFEACRFCQIAILAAMASLMPAARSAFGVLLLGDDHLGLRPDRTCGCKGYGVTACTEISPAP